MEWSFNSGKTWAKFEPEQLTIILTVGKKPNFADYISRADWKSIATASESNEIPLSAFLISQARIYLQSGDLRHALIEGVSALEIGLDNFIRRNVSTSDVLTKSVSAFFDISLKARVVTVVSSLKVVSQKDLERTVEAIEMRNRVVHEGWNPSKDDGPEIDSLLKTSAALLPGPDFKFPIEWHGNESKSLEDWERLEKKSS